MHPDLLPDGSEFAARDDTTEYTRDLHVACDDPRADDANGGGVDAPLKTIQAAADRAQPGERVVVHGGIYRECVVPPRGGKGPDRMISYVAAAGEMPVIRGTEVWQPELLPLRDPRKGPRRNDPARPAAWRARLPDDLLDTGNPFLAANLTRSRWFPWQKRPLEELERTQLRRGMLFADGAPLAQVHDASDLRRGPGTFWVHDDGRTLLVRLPGDADPAGVELEFTTRAQCFAPREPLGWIRVEGFRMERCGNGVPFPQRGVLSAGQGHHWIIRGNTVRHANAVGIDIGWQADLRPTMDPAHSGGHLVQNNVVADCGITGICGCGGVDGSLIEGNRLARIGGLDLEHCYEAAAIKVHGIKGGMIRGNVIRDCAHACGIWLDYLCGNSRVTGNRVVNISTVLAGIYIEANPAPIVVDRNIVAGLRDEPRNDPPKDGLAGGIGIGSDISESTVIERNLVVDCEGWALGCYRAQEGREVGGRLPGCRGMVVRDNLVAGCARGVLLTHGEGNAVDGNLYLGDTGTWRIDDHGGECGFADWAQAGFDGSGARLDGEATLDAATAAVSVTADLADLPDPERVRGPFEGEAWADLVRAARASSS